MTEQSSTPDLIQDAHDRHQAEVRMDLTESTTTTSRTSSIIGTVKIIRVRFLEDDVNEGDIPPECYEDPITEVFEWDENDTREEAIDGAVERIQREGLTFAATGNEWAANPDGTTIVNYGTGEREETTAHLNGFTEDEMNLIMERVG